MNKITGESKTTIIDSCKRDNTTSMKSTIYIKRLISNYRWNCRRAFSLTLVGQINQNLHLCSFKQRRQLVLKQIYVCLVLCKFLESKQDEANYNTWKKLTLHDNGPHEQKKRKGFSHHTSMRSSEQ